ncbi:3-keto-disaccharide hydrolase [Alienimonas californiensis]|uniref:3-keto-alpha-glucoside-1,2-lyase/3-keto-2-hydroxy-glucal hydratase domain-containing protein n=1 Tax=Alienimonas californiensis TaxID=2527989 RepID=A0A517PEE4_9PLAN|nr:DUF1080 domain-containing protein [Alienimonas californiensis]QDT17750.1 hypothetical protein CA12_38820 [Alienimonas californiensis]
MPFRPVSLFACLLLVGPLALASAAADDATPPKPTESEPTAVFNGENFDGWFFAPHYDPRKLAAMAPAERAEFLKTHAAAGLEHWRIEPGEGGAEIVNDGQGPYLWTDRDYTDFELSIDWKITAGTDSGIYLRGCPQVQIWDPDDADPNGNGHKFGSGGLWNNPKTGPNNRGKDPSERADKPMGEWNTFVIRVVGSTVTVHLNGKLIVNEATLENYWDRSQPLFPAGPIILQTHGGETRWRNVTVREIPRGMSESGFLLPDGGAAGEGWDEAAGNTATVGADVHAAFGPVTGQQTASVTVGTRVGTPGPAVSFEFAADGTVAAKNPLAEVARLGSGGGAGADGGPVPCMLVDRDAAAAAYDPAAVNRVYVRTADGSVIAYLNGTPILVAVDAPAARKEPIPFAVNGAEAKVLFVRAGDERQPPPGDEADFTAIPLEPGLPGWEGDLDGYPVEDGVMTCRGGGNVYLKEELSDFTVRFEFRLPEGGNNGVGLRFVKGENAAYSGMESQILDNAADRYRTIAPYQAHGSIYGVIPALRGYLAPVGHWNREEISLKGDRVTVKLNGKTLVDADIREASAGGAVDGQKHPGLLRDSGAFGFLGHGAPVAWRNLRLSVSPAAADAAAKAEGAEEPAK